MNAANDFREFWWALNTAPGNRIAITGRRATISGRRRGNLLDVHFALPAPDWFPKPHTLALMSHVQRCGCPNYVPDSDVKQRRAQYGPYACEMVHGPVYERPRLVAKVSGYNGRFMSLMLPRRRGGRPAAVRRRESPHNSLAVALAFGDAKDTLVFAYEHNTLEANGVSARGRWVALRRALPSRRILAWAIGHGSSLIVDGKSRRITRGIAEL